MFIDKTAQNPRLLIGNVFLFVFRIGEEEEYLFPADNVVDDPDAAAFTTTRQSPPDLPESLGALDEISGFGICDKHALEFTVGFVVDELRDLGGENRSLIEYHLPPLHTPSTYGLQIKKTTEIRNPLHHPYPLVIPTKNLPDIRSLQPASEKIRIDVAEIHGVVQITLGKFR